MKNINNAALAEATQLAMKQLNAAVLETSEASAEAIREAASPEEAYNTFIEAIGEGMTEAFATALASVVNNASLLSINNSEITGWEGFIGNPKLCVEFPKPHSVVRKNATIEAGAGNVGILPYYPSNAFYPGVASDLGLTVNGGSLTCVGSWSW